jgi:hypothetical protein
MAVVRRWRNTHLVTGGKNPSVIIGCSFEALCKALGDTLDFQDKGCSI